MQLDAKSEGYGEMRLEFRGLPAAHGQLSAEQDAAVADATRLFQEGIFTSAELESELARIRCDDGRVRGEGEQWQQVQQQGHVAGAAAAPVDAGAWCASAPPMNPTDQAALHEAGRLFHEGIFTQADLERERDAILKRASVSPREFAVHRAGYHGNPSPAGLPSLGICCPHCARDFSGTTPSSRNGAMARHIKKCAAKGGEASKRASGSAGRPRSGENRASLPAHANEREIAKTRADDGPETGWWVKGSEYLGKRVRRAVYDEETGEIVGAADGEIVGWLPLEVADFVSEFFHKPAALWHMVYDNEAVGEEDLEEFEVRDAVNSFLRDAWADLGEDEERAERAACREKYLAENPRSSPFLGEASPDVSESSDEEAGDGAGSHADEVRKRKRAGSGTDGAGDGAGGVGGEKKADGKEDRPAAPKRHKEVCIEEGVWRVTECPKKPVNAYMMWFLENRHDIQQHSAVAGDAAQAKISKIASELWKAMPESVKDGYKRRNQLALDDFHRDVAAYKQYCAATGIRPKFSCGGEGKETNKKGGRDCPPGGGSKSKSKREKKEGKNPARSKHPAVAPWFALVLDTVEDTSFQLLEVSSGVHSDGSCKAREWLLHDVVEAANAPEGGGEVARFVAASLYPQMMRLPALGWLPVMVTHDMAAVGGQLAPPAAASSSRRSPVEAGHGAEAPDDVVELVVIRNEAQCVREARRILAGELEREPFPAKHTPLPRLLGAQTPPASPAVYLERVERLLLPHLADTYAGFRAILQGFKQAVAAGAERAAARAPAAAQVGELFREPPLDRLLAGFDLFLPLEAPRQSGVGGVSGCQGGVAPRAAVASGGLSAEGASLLADLAGHVGGAQTATAASTAWAPAPESTEVLATDRADDGGVPRRASGGCPFLAGRVTTHVYSGTDARDGGGASGGRGMEQGSGAMGTTSGVACSTKGLRDSAAPSASTDARGGAGACGECAQAQVETGGGQEAAAGHKVDGEATIGERAAADVQELKAQLTAAWGQLRQVLSRGHCAPMMLRLAWHDASSYDKSSNLGWPLQGGANGSVRLIPELDYPTNKGLAVALSLLDPLLQRFDMVSAADLIQMAGAAAVEASGGPSIRLRYGRRQTDDGEQCSSEESSKRAATAVPPFPDGAASAAAHLRALFSRMGFSDSEAVALMGAHTLGRAHRSRSGHGAAHTPYTKDVVTARPRGGSSWTQNWNTFDNSYFRELAAPMHDARLLKLPTDLALLEDPAFRGHVERFARDQQVFFTEYAAAHVRMSEAGALFDPPGGIFLDQD